MSPTNNTPFPSIDWGGGVTTTARPLRLTRGNYARYHQVSGLQHPAHIIENDQDEPGFAIYIGDVQVNTTTTLSEAVDLLRTL